MINPNISGTEAEEFKISKSYMDPIVYLLILIFGLLGNGSPLFKCFYVIAIFEPCLT
jgi:hypothetical protein